jgi:lysophospholipase L1-like esterase
VTIMINVLVGLAAVLLLAGCGSSKPMMEQTTLVAALGDSITAGSPGYDPDPRQRDNLGFGSNEKSQWEYWAQREHPELRFRNCGVYGERTDEIAARLDECAKGAQILIVQGGINDIAQGRPLEPAAENLRAMVERGKHHGLRVAIAELLPWNNGYPEADPKIRRLNELIHGIALDEHVRVLPFYETLEDPARPGRMKEEWTSDGDHPSVDGYRRLGERAFPLP